jgi:prepilin-type N-terminal cleavage/methylation domain-containing protein
MFNMVKLFRLGERRRRGRSGFTLVEMVIALAISGIILVGATAMYWFLVVHSVSATNQALANHEVNYANYWISQDVVQAGNITLAGNSTTGNFPLIITIPGNITISGNPGNSTVIYSVENMEDKFGNDLWRLNRTKIEYDGTSSTSMIAEYLLPWSEIPLEIAKGNQGTECTVKGNVTAYERRVILQVGALVDKSVALARYEIYPRVRPPVLGNETG